MVDRITLLVEPHRQPLEGSTSEPARSFYEVDRLAELLRLAGVAQVDVVEDFLSHAPDEGFVIWQPSTTLAAALSECSEAQQKQLAPRLVLLQGRYEIVVGEIERYGFAAAFDYLPYFRWKTGQPAPGGASGLVGLSEVGKRLGATVSRPVGQYALLSLSACPDLPTLLLAYLDEYASFIWPASTFD